MSDLYQSAHKARIEATLGTLVRHNGEPRLISRRDLIDQKVSRGARIVIRKNGERVLLSLDGTFLDTENITKIGLDYAAAMLASEG